MKQLSGSRAQGSLEYLIIITAVLAISAAVIMFLVSMSEGQEETASVAACKLEASKCKLTLYSVPDDPCTSCESACKTKKTGEVALYAVNCCKLGETAMIGSGSIEQTESKCIDGLDNDCDGKTDGDDSDCSS